MEAELGRSKPTTLSTFQQLLGDLPRSVGEFDVDDCEYTDTDTLTDSSLSLTDSHATDNHTTHNDSAVMSTRRRHPSPSNDMCHLVMVSLLEQLCKLYERDSQSANDILEVLCKHLIKMGVIEPVSLMEDSSIIRSKFGELFERIIASARKDCLPMTSTDPAILLTPTPLQPLNIPKILVPDSLKEFFPSRFNTEFDNHGMIDKGGFGKVYKVKNKLDRKFYAVKQIKCDGFEKNAWEKVIREVKALANLQHENIVSYNTAWLEWDTSSKNTDRNYSDESDSSSVDRSYSAKKSSSPEKYTVDGVDLNGGEPVVKPGRNSFITDSDLNESTENLSKLLVSELNIMGERKNSNFSVDFVSIEEEIATSNSDDSTYVENVTVENLNVNQNYDCPVSKGVMNSAITTDPQKCPVLENHGIIAGKFTDSNIVIRQPFRSLSTNIGGRGVNGMEIARRKANNPYNLNVRDLRRCKSERGRDGSDLVCCSGLNQTDGFMHGQPRLLLYIQMELCSQTLRNWMDDRNQHSSNSPCQIDYNTNLGYLHQILSGVQYIHSMDIVHRDIKPSNIFLQNDCAKIGDFGLVCDDQRQTFDERTTVISPVMDPAAYREYLLLKQSSEEMGTGIYVSPEQSQRRPCDSKSDMYSIGLILYELFQCFHTGMERVNNMQHLKMHGRKNDRFITQYPRLVETVDTLLSIDPTKRPTASHILDSNLFITQHQKEISKLKQKIIKSKNREYKLRKKISSNEKVLVSNDREICKKDDVIATKDVDLVLKEQEIVELKQSIRTKDSKLHENLITIQSKNVELTQKELIIQEMADKIRMLES